MFVHILTNLAGFAVLYQLKQLRSFRQPGHPTDARCTRPLSCEDAGGTCREATQNQHHHVHGLHDLNAHHDHAGNSEWAMFIEFIDIHCEVAKEVSTIAMVVLR